MPLIIVLGAGISAAHRHQRATLLERTVTNPSADALQRMSWQEFKLLVGEGFRRRGYGVLEPGGRGTDGGKGLVLTAFLQLARSRERKLPLVTTNFDCVFERVGTVVDAFRIEFAPSQSSLV